MKTTGFDFNESRGDKIELLVDPSDPVVNHTNLVTAATSTQITLEGIFPGTYATNDFWNKHPNSKVRLTQNDVAFTAPIKVHPPEV